MTLHLKQLEAAYQPYVNFWEQWKLQSISGLTALEIYVIEIQKQNDFIIEPEHQVMFYNQTKVIEEITGKLNGSYCKYQDWVMQKFIDQFIRLVGFPDFEIKCAIPFLLLDLNENVKNELAKLEAKSVLYFFEQQGENKWRKRENFKKLQSVVIALTKNTVSAKITQTKKRGYEKEK